MQARVETNAPREWTIFVAFSGLSQMFVSPDCLCHAPIKPFTQNEFINTDTLNTKSVKYELISFGDHPVSDEMKNSPNLLSYPGKRGSSIYLHALVS